MKNPQGERIIHRAQKRAQPDRRARNATEDYGAMEGFDSFTDCLAYYLRQAESDLILP